MAFVTPLSEYELLRERNIKERESLWQEVLKEKADFSEATNPKQAKARCKKAVSFPGATAPVRRSGRLKGKPIRRFMYIDTFSSDLKRQRNQPINSVTRRGCKYCPCLVLL